MVSSCGCTAASSSGSVPPMSAAGAATSTNGITQASTPTFDSSATNTGGAAANARVAVTPRTAMPNSRAAYMRTGLDERSAMRPNTALPRASPAKKPLTPVVTA